jgi:hypothetical protein
LDDLSRLHAGAPARLVVLDAEQGVQSHGDTFTLVGLTSDGQAGAETIAVILARGTHVTHIIDQPRSLVLEQLWESRTANLQVIAVDGTRTLISLGTPVLAGTRRSGTAMVGTSPRPCGLLRAAGAGAAPKASRLP